MPADQEPQSKVFKASEVKVLESLGLVVGKAIVCTEKGEDHYDLQGDHIPELVAVEAMVDFMEGARTHKVMHQGEAAGEFSGWLPIVESTKAALGIECDWTGIAVCFRPSEEIMAKYVDGTYTGFSIGGLCAYDEEEA